MASIVLRCSTSPRTSYRSRRLFCKNRLSLILSQLLSQSTRCAGLRFGFGHKPESRSIYRAAMFRAEAKSALLRRFFMRTHKTASTSHSPKAHRRPAPPRNDEGFRGRASLSVVSVFHSALSSLLWRRAAARHAHVLYATFTPIRPLPTYALRIFDGAMVSAAHGAR